MSRPPAPTDTLRVAPKAFWKVGCLLLALPSSSRQEEQTFPIAAFVSNRSTAVRQQQNTKKKQKKNDFIYFAIGCFFYDIRFYFVAFCLLRVNCTSVLLYGTDIVSLQSLLLFLSFYLFKHEKIGNHVVLSFVYSLFISPFLVLACLSETHPILP